MAELTIAEYLKYANLQMAAEAFIRDESTLILGTSTPDVVRALIRGNEHASRFTPTEAAKFADPATGWTVLDQRANTNTGFSGTLFRNNRTRELVLSFRSTEFLDDNLRDSQATNILELKQYGFAFGQIRDMETWYRELLARTDDAGNPLLAGQSVSVTGYSLGAHVATAFHLLRREEAARGVNDVEVSQVVTFNGAGVGKVKNGASLTSILDEFNGLLADPERIIARLGDADLQADYRLLHGNRFTSSEDVQAARRMIADHYQVGLGWRLENAKRVYQALGEIDQILTERLRLAGLREGGSGTGVNSYPKVWSASRIDGLLLDYRMAAKLTGMLTESASSYAGIEQAIGDKAYLDVRAANQYDLVGTETYRLPAAMVGNSQWHFGQDVKIFVEDQPLRRGSAAGVRVDLFLTH